MVTERQAVKSLQQLLHDRYSWVTAHRKPSASKPLRQQLEAKLGYIPILQPEIDLAFGDKGGSAYAVEVKLVPVTELSFSLPFYEGIGQALALHRYGFDAVALWTVFVGSAIGETASQYGAQAWYFLRNELDLPLDFTFFYLDPTRTPWSFVPQQYLNARASRPLAPLNNRRFPIHFRHPNPLRLTRSASEIRRVLVPWLIHSVG